MHVDENVSKLLYEWLNDEKREDILVQAYM
jgi:hypothetical protein